MELADVSRLLPSGLGTLSAEQTEAARDEFPKRIWYMRDDRKSSAWVFCEGCGSWFDIEARKDMPKHRAEYSCPHCKFRTYAYSLRRSHTGMYDDLMMTFFDKGADGRTLIARTFYAVRDYAGEAWIDQYSVEDFNPQQVETQFMLYGVCAMRYEDGIAERWESETIFTYKTDYQRRRFTPTLMSDGCESGPQGRLIKRKSPGSPMRTVLKKCDIFGGTMYRHALSGVYFPNELREAMDGMLLGKIYELAREKLDEELYISRGCYNKSAVSPDRTAELMRLCRCRTVEYLLRLGLEGIAVNKLCGIPSSVYRLNWRGKTAAAVLRIPQSDIRAARSAGVEITEQWLAMRARLLTLGVHADPRQIENAMLDRTNNYLPDRDFSRFAGERRRKAIRFYLRMQKRGVLLGDICDYWEECEQLNDDLTDDAVAFPKNLQELHERNRQRIEIIRNRETDKWISKRWKKLNETVGFSANGILLRPALSAQEIVEEGQKLKHCVGSYVKSYADGRTIICVMRREDAPDTPWRTVEISPKTLAVVQDRGYRNDLNEQTKTYCVDDELKAELDAFWALWSARMRAPSKKKSA